MLLSACVEVDIVARVRGSASERSGDLCARDTDAIRDGVVCNDLSAIAVLRLPRNEGRQVGRDRRGDSERPFMDLRWPLRSEVVVVKLVVARLDAGGVACVEP